MTGVFDVRLTQEAEDDLEANYDYLAEQESVAMAIELVVEIREKIVTLERFPSRGPVLPETAHLGMSELRQTYHPPYRLIYEIADTTVYVFMIVDSRHDVPSVLEQRLLRR